MLVSVGVWACASVRSGGGDSNGRGVATTAATRVATTITPTTSPAPTTVPIGAPLTITIKDLRNKKGNLVFGVFKSAAGFPTVESKSVYWEVRDAGADSLTFTTHLPPGRYGASVLHDENRDGKMDRGFGGLPLEGYGVTNNPKPFMRAATFKEATFDLPAAGAAKTISLQYFQ
ncbi:MAG: hypothetical protein QOF78_2487 [Phycisphaerales bacterium]|nr:hypothetical protein [Phycisphaerales bacterium]